MRVISNVPNGREKVVRSPSAETIPVNIAKTNSLFCCLQYKTVRNPCYMEPPPAFCRKIEKSTNLFGLLKGFSPVSGVPCCTTHSILCSTNARAFQVTARCRLSSLLTNVAILAVREIPT